MQILAALVSGALLILASPPFNGWPLAFTGLIPVWLATRSAAPGRAAALGWLAGLVYHTGGSLWWYTVLERTVDLPAPVRLLMTMGVAAWHAVVYAVWAGAVSLLAGRFRLSRLLTAPLCMALAETVVPYLFKWYLAIAVWQVWPVVQAAELGGPAAVSAVVVLANAVAAEVLLALWRRRAPARAVLAGLVVLLAALGAGWLRGAYVETARREAPKISAALVQPGAALFAEEDFLLRRQGLLRELGRASAVLLAQGMDLVIWPETAWPGLLLRPLPGTAAPPFIQALLTGFDGRLLFGASTLAADGSRFNSAVLMAPSGQVEGYADKIGLVPFMEYAPFAGRFPGLAETVRQRLHKGASDLSPGTAPAVIAGGPLRLGVLVCSEELQLDRGLAVARLNPNLLVGLASDFQLRGTTAPFQHMAISMFRAVEMRRDFLHVAGAGVSAMVDATGRVRLLAEFEPGQPQTVSTLRGEAALLDLFSPGPYVIRLFPPGCLLALVLAALHSRLSLRAQVRRDRLPEAAQAL